MDTLPTELLTTIFDYLDLNDKKKLRLVNRKINHVIDFSLKRVTHVYVGESFPFHLSPSQYVSYLVNKGQKVSPRIWSFLDKYCADSIHLYCDLDVNLKSIITLAPKLKTIVILYPEKDDYSELVFKCKQLLDLRPTSLSHLCLTNTIAKERMKRGEDVIHLSLPCNEKCFSKKASLPRSLNCLSISDEYIGLPIITNQIAGSLVELNIIYDFKQFNIKSFPNNFTSLKNLSLYLMRCSKEDAMNIFRKFESSFSTLEYLFIGSDYANYYVEELNYFVSSFKKLVTCELCLSDDAEKMTLNLTSSNLKKLKIFAAEAMTLNVASTKITDLALDDVSPINFHMDFSHLLTLSIEESKISTQLLLTIEAANQLRSLILVNCHFEDNSLQYFSNDFLAHFSLLKNLKFKSREENSLEKVCINITKNQSLESLSFDSPVKLIVANFYDKLEYSKLSGKKPQVNFNYSNGDLCKISFQDVNHLDLIFNHQMSNLVSVSIDQNDYMWASPFVNNLMSQLESKCSNVASVKFSFRSIHPFNSVLRNRIVDWVRSLHHLKTFIVPVSDTYFTEIKKTFPYSQLELRISKVDESMQAFFSSIY